MSLPTHQEINVSDSLDERSACKHFPGKNLAEAEALFRQNALFYQEDLMWMGPIAFRYYVTAASRYLESEAATHDSHMVNCFVNLLEFRWQHEPKELTPIAEQLYAICAYLIENCGKFNLGPELEHIRPRLDALRETFLKTVLEY